MALIRFKLRIRMIKMVEQHAETKKLVIDNVDYTISWHDNCNTCMKYYYAVMESMEEQIVTLDVDNEHRRSVIFDLKRHVELTHSTNSLQNGADHKCSSCDNGAQTKCDHCDKYLCYSHYKCCGACGENLCQAHDATPCKENENHMLV